MRLRRTTKINLFIPVEFINEEECEALKTGVLTVIRNEIELVVTAGDIPESITVDLSPDGKHRRHDHYQPGRTARRRETHPSTVTS